MDIPSKKFLPNKTSKLEVDPPWKEGKKKENKRQKEIKRSQSVSQSVSQCKGFVNVSAYARKPLRPLRAIILCNIK